MIKDTEYHNLLFFDKLKQLDSVSHFSTTRNGGVSSGEFSSLNLGNYSDDSSLNIYENRKIVARKFHIEEEYLITPHQTHGCEVINIDKEFLNLPKSEQVDMLYGIDASITKEKGIFICVTTADCVPILLYDPMTNSIAGIHAGWKGTSGRIIKNTINAMIESFGTSPNDLIACIGPSISIDNYEVGQEVEDIFNSNGFVLDNSNSYRNSQSGKIHLDLKEINRQELISLGVNPHNIEKTTLCTYENEDLFFSARRQTIHSGRMLTAIMLNK